MFKPVNSKPNFTELEQNITRFWKENKIFEKSIQNRDPKNSYIFYDGPPFITGTPHYGSLLPSIAKDVVPRYQTMRGKRVERVWGWDCHGLPIETKVEKILGIKNRREIEKYGIQKFIDECYNYTRDTSAEWRWYIDKIGRWVDMDNAYRTMDQDYMETVMWMFKQLHDKDLIYKGTRTSLFCTRCGTPVSNFEIAMDNSYSDMEDPAVTVKFEVTSPGKFKGKSILAWTTTPWTLPSNKALVIDPKETYIVAQVQKLDIELELCWLVKELPPDIKKYKHSEITQAYLENYTDNKNKNIKDVRVRKLDSEYELTIKYYAGSSKESAQIIEKTESISKDRYIELVKQATKKIVKTRYYYPLENNLIAEIDIYRNQLDGVNVVEVEFPSLRRLHNFSKPNWFGNEVTDSQACWPLYMSDKTSSEILKDLNNYIQPQHNFDEKVQTEEVILAKKRVDYVMKDIDYKVNFEFKGKELLGLHYTPPFSYFDSNKSEHQVYNYKDMVNMNEGTGIVHSAPGFGDIDTEMGQENNLSIAMSIADDGKYLSMIKEFEGIYVKEADPLIIENLKTRNLLFRSERIIHRYPYCWRCETPLIHKAQPSWFININKIRKDLLANNEKINWVPKHLKHGRFKKGIEVAPDWGISRTRYWATPMPVWEREENGKIIETKIISSRDELRENSIQPITKLTVVTYSTDSELPKLISNLEYKDVDHIYFGLQKENIKKEELLDRVPLERVKYHKLFTNLAVEDKLAKLLKQHNALSFSELPESEIENTIADTLLSFKAELRDFLEDHKGEHIIAFTHSENISILQHLVEGKRLKETLSNKTIPGQSTNIYFLETELLDLHRPKIDKITLKGKTGELTRIKEVLDVWLDSASMPYASKHYPFQNKQVFEENYPADFIVEYIAQTRAWFYVMHVASTALFNKPSFKNVITTGVISGTDGRKMSKSYGNYPDPRETLEKYGAEALRLYFMSSHIMLGEDMNFNEENLKEQIKIFLLPLWNSYSFFVTYANLHKWSPKNTSKSTNPLDLWILAQLELTKKNFIFQMESYDIPSAVKVLPEFVDILSRWYIRRSRQRFADGDKQALSTLYSVLIEFIKICAPIVPFSTEDIFLNLSRGIDGFSESVHLENLKDYKENVIKDSKELVEKMDMVRTISTLGQSLRVQNSLKVRQPLSEICVKIQKTQEPNKEELIWMIDIIKDELNVKKVTFLQNLPEGKDWLLAKNTLSISLNSKITPELEQEGILREVTRQIQNQRKKLGLQMGDFISIKLQIEDKKLEQVISRNLESFKESINAKTLEIVTTKQAQQLDINGKIITISID